MTDAILLFFFLGYGIFLLEVFTSIPSTLVDVFLRSQIGPLSEEITRLRKRLCETERKPAGHEVPMSETAKAILNFVRSTGRASINAQEFSGGRGAVWARGPRSPYAGPAFPPEEVLAAIQELVALGVLGAPSLQTY